MNEDKKQYVQDNVTLVSAFYIMKNKHSYYDFLIWINNLVKLNSSMVLFTQKSFINILKELRPKEFYNKTVFIELEMEDFYSYQNFAKEFNESFYIDYENSFHTVPLYIVWAEKCNFIKKAILKNYFNSKCFYWIDADLFPKKSDLNGFLNNWPSTNKCYQNSKVLITSLRDVGELEKEKLKNFDKEAHKYFMHECNVDSSVFGGQPEKLLKFSDLYYDAIRLFIKNNIFIGKEQNLFAFVAYLHPDIVELHRDSEWGGLINYIKD